MNLDSSFSPHQRENLNGSLQVMQANRYTFRLPPASPASKFREDDFLKLALVSALTHLLLPGANGSFPACFQTWAERLEAGRGQETRLRLKSLVDCLDLVHQEQVQGSIGKAIRFLSIDTPWLPQ